MKTIKKDFGRRFSFSPWLSTIFILTAFLYFTVQIILSTNQIATKLVYGFVFVIFGIVFALAEFLRYHYNQAIFELVMHCNIDKAIHNIQIVEKYDIFKSYHIACKVFQTLLFVDQHKIDHLKRFLDQHKALFDKSVDLQLIFAYNQFVIARESMQSQAIELYYNKLKQMTTVTINRKRLAPVFSWDMIDAMYYLSIQDVKRASKALSCVKTEHMNKRELTHYYLQAASLASTDNKKTKARNYMQKAIEMAPNMPAVIEMGVLHEKE